MIFVLNSCRGMKDSTSAFPGGGCGCAAAPNNGKSTTTSPSKRGSDRQIMNSIRGRLRQSIRHDADYKLAKGKSKSKSKSPVRSIDRKELSSSSSSSPPRTRSKSPTRTRGRRHRSISLSPIRLLRHGIQKNLHMAPEGMNESSSGSFHLSNSAAFRQEQMIQAFAMEEANGTSNISLDDFEDFEDFESRHKPADLLKVPAAATAAAPSILSSTSDGVELVSDIAVDPANDHHQPFIDAITEGSECETESEYDEIGCREMDVTLHRSPGGGSSITSASIRRKSLERLSELPDYYCGTAGSTSAPSQHRTGRRSSYTNRHSATSSTIASGISRLSFNSMTSVNSISSMPSLSSIMEQDVMSVGTNQSGGNCTVMTGTSSINTTSVTGGGDLPSLSEAIGGGDQSIILSLTPPLAEAKLGPTYSSSSNSSLTNNTRRKHPSPIVSDPAVSKSTSAIFKGSLLRPNVTSAKLHHELSHLAGTSLDILGPNIENPHKNLPQQRWESDAPPKKPPAASSSFQRPATRDDSQIPHGNPDVAPLTHDQKLLLPNRRLDVQPVYVARRGSDVSITSRNIASLMANGDGSDESSQPCVPTGMGSLTEHSPVQRDALLQRNKAQQLPEPGTPNSNKKDTIPTVARRMSSSSTMAQSLENISWLDLSTGAAGTATAGPASPDINPAILQLPRREDRSAAKERFSSTTPVKRTSRRFPPPSKSRSSDSYLPRPPVRPPSPP